MNRIAVSQRDLVKMPPSRWKRRVRRSFLGLWLVLALSARAVDRSATSNDPLVPVPVRPVELLQPVGPDLEGWRLGPADLHLGLSGSLTYDDNIELSSTNKLEDGIVRLVPQVRAVVNREVAGQGSWLELDYRPLAWLFFDHTGNNELDHRVYASGRWSSPKLRLGVSQAYEQDSGAVVEAGARLKRQLYTTTLLGRYQLSEVSTVTLTPRLEIEQGRQIINNRDWALDGFYDYELSPKLRLGAGLTLGLWDLENNPTEYYQRLLLRARYTLSERLNFGATAGLEIREYESNRSETVTPVCGVDALWQPRDSTLLSLEVHARDEPSLVIGGLDYTTVGLSAQFRQRFAERWFASLGGGYDNRDYRSSMPGLSTSRVDDYYFARAGAGLESRTWRVGLYYLRQENNSTVDRQEFENNQVTLEAAWGF